MNAQTARDAGNEGIKDKRGMQGNQSHEVKVVAGIYINVVEKAHFLLWFFFHVPQINHAVML
jgi:hypothetical protein